MDYLGTSTKKSGEIKVTWNHVNVVLRRNNPKRYFEILSNAGKIGGKIGGKLSVITNKKNKTGLYDSRVKRMGGIATHKKHPNLASKNGKLVAQKYGGWAWITKKQYQKNGIKSSLKNKKNKVGAFFDPVIRSEMARRGGLAAQKTLRYNIRNLKFNNQYYDSKPEIEISLCLQHQFNYKPFEDKTLHVKICWFEYDYLIKKLKLFIEYHPWFQNITEEEYYNKRRLNLDNNKYKDYKLVVIS